MTNIWSFLVQTSAVTMTILLLLLLKKLMERHFSPFWQYGTWSIVALRVLLPASMSVSLLPPLMEKMEIFKAAAEQKMPDLLAASNYTAPWQSIEPKHPFPVIIGMPQSITDWLFVVYAVGMTVCLLRYGWIYIRLRYALKNSPTASAEQLAQIAQVCERYDLKSCRIVTAAGLESAFVCGVFAPILALPEDRTVDDKILLHELLHLKYHDPAQTLFWCGVRVLHWCNPIVWWACDRIGNDMETLCDQRVLERLEGEERRDYGRILLDMANEKYARLPGTSSISNGGVNIRRRIESLVRFKTFPGGMQLLYICLIAILAVPMLSGEAAAYDSKDYFPGNEEQLARAMALSRIHRCTTPAGAIDTYAKAVMGTNYAFLSTVTPLEKHEELWQTIREKAWGYSWLEGLDGLGFAYTNIPYHVYDLTEQSGGSYTAILSIYGNAPNEPGGDVYLDEKYRVYGEGTLFIPIRVWKSTDGWCAEETGPRQVVPGLIGVMGEGESPLANHTDFGTGKIFRYAGEYGILEVEQHIAYTIQERNNTVSSEGYYRQSEIGAPIWDAELQQTAYIHTVIRFDSGREDLKKSGYALHPIENDENFTFADDYMKKNTEAVIKSEYRIYEDLEHIHNFGDELPVLSDGWKAGIYWDSKLVATVDLQEVER